MVFPGESLNDELVAQEDLAADLSESGARFGKFVFALACGGSHSGVLAIDLDNDHQVRHEIKKEEQAGDEEEGDIKEGSPVFRFLNPFRIGLAGAVGR